MNKAVLFMPDTYLNRIVSMLVLEFRKEFGENFADIGGCLCHYGEKYPDIFERYKIILAHPHKSEECLNKIKSLVESHPKNDFYIFSIGRGEITNKRKKIIGKHSNLEYLTDTQNMNNAYKKIKEQLS